MKYSVLLIQGWVNEWGFESEIALDFLSLVYWVREEAKWLLLSADDRNRLEIMDRII